MKYKMKPVIIEATQWFKNGDHPLDYSKTHTGLENGELRQFYLEERRMLEWEGDVVRYYRHPKMDGQHKCRRCGNIMHDHGWIESIKSDHIVCPGDYILTDATGEYYPCKPDVFAATYEVIE